MQSRWSNGYLVLLLPISAAAVLVFAYLFYYDGADFAGTYDPPPAVDVGLDDLVVSTVVVKGFEFQPHTVDIDIDAGRRDTLVVSLERFADMAASAMRGQTSLRTMLIPIHATKGSIIDMGSWALTSEAEPRIIPV